MPGHGSLHPRIPTKLPSSTIGLPAADPAPTFPAIPSPVPIIAKPSLNLREFLLKESKRVVDDIKTSGVVRPPYLDEEEVPMDGKLIEDGDYYPAPVIFTSFARLAPLREMGRSQSGRWN